MGAWGVGALDNDTACDWADELAQANDLSRVEGALDAVLAEEEFLDSDVASEALAACEVIARLLGGCGVRNAYTESIDTWTRAHPQVPPPELIARAHAAIDRILAEDSELRELWQETGDPSEWLDAVAELRGRLQPRS